VRHRLSKSEHENAPARVVLLVNSVDFECDTCSRYETGQDAEGRRTEDHVAIAVLIGHWQDLRTLRGKETNPAGCMLPKELFAGGL
jgi:hypothetical protein